VDHPDGKGDFLKLRKMVVHQPKSSSTNIPILSQSLVGTSGIEQHHSRAISFSLLYRRNRLFRNSLRVREFYVHAQFI
jgi:hypothetical protein